VSFRNEVIEFDAADLEDRSMLNELGAAGWEAYHVDVSRCSFRGPNFRDRSVVSTLSSGVPLQQTVELERSYSLKRPVAAL
jgi:hypothetical protein